MVVCVHSDYRILLKVQEERYFAKFRYGDKLYNNFDVPYRKRFNANACVRVCLPIPFDDPSMDQEEQEEEPKKRQNTRSSSGRKLSSPTHLSDYELGELASTSKKEPAKSAKSPKKPAQKRPKCETPKGGSAKKQRCATKEDAEYKPTPTKQKLTKVKQQARGKSTYKNYSLEDLMKAVREASGGRKVDKVSKEFGIPSRTIYDKMRKLGLKTSRRTSESEAPSTKTLEEEAKLN